MTQQRTERPPVLPRSGRRPIPPVIFLLVLALAGLGVWWNVFRTEETRQAEAAAACTSAEPAAPSLDPATVSVRVFNATDRANLATEVAGQLQERGFTVAEIANDPTEREVTGVGEIRYGPRGSDAAEFLGVYLPEAGDYLDTRATAQVDLVLGPDYAGLASPEQVAAAFDTAAEATATC